ncbi:4-hydroxy-tetrahydrodipicolinate reductase [Jannaschia pagri]|uniref:4-hydroxy-tetrahydrodipicolinate reductase n=1 Tax=Jannaschia pagri TaxID=2829797 RepID=A0ABQ4NK66_9RHOB|nr:MULTISPECIES: 4-hydroxy-tetrahydrodipicolinate reductase [unclassified Jannaschia]GIT90955.1 4-hydroxy-tetrahydrodipicolinate reductase [Jannaschia sp. AI_61]GIT94787.1 4-hydroxy-tetrahydrodipicolinate reductase [Jannaschia sp. AI_62]
MTQTTDSTGIVIMGGSGRMGRMLIDVITASDSAHIIGVTEAPGHPWAGRDLGEALGGAASGVPVTDQALDVVAKAQAVIDFTTPTATLAMSKVTAQTGAVHVVGTTGMTADDIAALDRAAQETTIVRAGNMSLGVNLLTQIVRQVAAALDDDYDIEVVETHHRHKVDAPSGTALMLGEAAAAGRGVDLDTVADRARDGITGARTRGSIGFHALRGGDVVGDHDVIFAADGERITLRHQASDRSVFARGALKAALWGQGKGPGAFDMLDVLGLR